LKNKRLILILVCVFALSSCDNKSTENVKETQIESEIESETQPETEEKEIVYVVNEERVMTYSDASYKWHYMTIKDNVPANTYDHSKFIKEDGKMTYEDDKYTYRCGVDVSKFQDKVKWNKVASDGYEFAFIRLGYRGYTEGDMFLDEKYEYNIKAANRSGLDVGVYFFSQAINEEEAVEEAEFVLDNIKDYQIEMPIVYDPETVSSSNARTKDITKEQYTKNCKAFCDTIKEAGYDPMIYMNLIWQDKKLNLEELTEYPIWYADYVGLPQTPYNFNIWQYTDTGSVSGISGKCDIDIQIIEK